VNQIVLFGVGAIKTLEERSSQETSYGDSGPDIEKSMSADVYPASKITVSLNSTDISVPSMVV
jgi:hypothetical protein